MAKDHMEGFEKEEKFRKVKSKVYKEFEKIIDQTLREIIADFDPEFLDGLYKRRPCIRKLRYQGIYWDPEFDREEHEYFQIGKIYESLDFNGTGYTIKGYREGKVRVGSAYFEWID